MKTFAKMTASGGMRHGCCTAARGAKPAVDQAVARGRGFDPSITFMRACIRSQLSFQFFDIQTLRGHTMSALT